MLQLSISGKLSFTMSCYRRYLQMQVMLLLISLGNAENECSSVSCGSYDDGSFKEIRFPFHLVNGSNNNNNHSGCPGFALSCTKYNKTMLQFPANPALMGVTLTVDYIDYESRRLYTHDPAHCLPGLFLQLFNSSISPFQFDSYIASINLTFFNCSSMGSTSLYKYHGYSQNMSECPIYVVDSYESVAELSLVSCTKMFDLVSPVHLGDLWQNNLTLRWSKPKCDYQNFHCNHKPSKITTIILPATGSIVLVLLLIGLFLVYRYYRMKGDDEARLEKFLEDYRALRPTRFSYADLKRITNHFKDKVGEGAHGAVFRGKLSTEILVAVKVLNNSEWDGKEFINEVGSLGKIHHINVVRLLGFCADGSHRALVYDFFPNGSLQKFISSPDNKDSFLGFLKLQQIALGIAKGIEYLHQGCDHRILHFDINPHNVLLDNKLTPQITDFGLAKLCSKNQSTVSMTAARGTLGYMAPEVFSRNFGNVSYKSDIYSYGMLLLEMVGGRKNTSTTQETLQVLYPEWIHNLVEGRDINIHIEDEEDIRIAKKLAIVGLWCIQWHPVNRPSIITVLQMLEGEGDKLKVPPTPFDSTTSTNTSVLIPTRRMNLELEVIRELE